MQLARSKQVITLFDVDGTLTKPRNVIQTDMIETLLELQQKHYVAIVGGSDLVKIREQIGSNLLNQFDYVFSENGLLSFRSAVEFHRQSLKDYLGEKNLQRFINFTLRELSYIELPVKRGTFIEYRNGMLNISPVGRNCSQSERDDFEQYDHQHGIRKKLIANLKKEFSDLPLKYSIGGQISFDVFPVGWDKTYCLQFLEEFKEIHFFGDKTFEGGNDYEIHEDPRTIGHAVKSPADTIALIKSLFLVNTQQ